jgi:hypothetical protein
MLLAAGVSMRRTLHRLILIYSLWLGGSILVDNVAWRMRLVGVGRGG